MKGSKYNEGDPYGDLFLGGDYKNSLVEFEEKESFLYDKEVYDINTDKINNQYLSIEVPISRNNSTQEGIVLH